jgi:hypothetical protein
MGSHSEGALAGCQRLFCIFMKKLLKARRHPGGGEIVEKSTKKA